MEGSGRSGPEPLLRRRCSGACVPTHGRSFAWPSLDISGALSFTDYHVGVRSRRKRRTMVQRQEAHRVVKPHGLGRAHGRGRSARMRLQAGVQEVFEMPAAVLHVLSHRREFSLFSSFSVSFSVLGILPSIAASLSCAFTSSTPVTRIVLTLRPS